MALYEMVRRLDKKRFEPVILCYELNRYTKVFEQLGVKVLYLNQQQPVEANLPLTVNQKIPIKLFAPLRKFKRLLVDDRMKSKQIASIILDNKVDLIHHNNDINDSRQAVLANRKIKLPQVCHYRSLKPYHNDLLNFRIDYFMARHIDFHIYISKAVQDHFSKALRIKKTRGEVVRDIIDVEKYKPQAVNQDLLNEFGLSANDIIITNIGRISRWKGQHVFIEAIAKVSKKHPQVKALIVGPYDPGIGDPVYYNELQQMVVDHNLKDKVTFTGNRNDIPGILSISNIIVHSAIEPEPQGLVIIEALFYGKPVIVSDAGGAAELIIDNEGGLKVQPGNVAELTLAIEKLMGQIEAEKRSVSIKKKLAIFSEFIPEKQIKIIEGIYDFVTWLR